MIEVAYILDRFPSPSETFIEREIRDLRGLGLRIAVFALDGGTERHREAIGPDTPIRIVYLPPPLSRVMLAALVRCARAAPLRHFSTIAGMIVSNARNPRHFVRIIKHYPAAVYVAAEISRMGIGWIHAHFASVPALVAGLASSLLGMEYSLTAHARDIHTGGISLRGNIERASFVITCTRFNRNVLIERFGAQADRKIHVIHHGLDPRAYAGDGGTVRPQTNAGGEPVEIASVGRLVEKKGFPHLVDACLILKEKGRRFRCTIAGDGPERQKLMEMIRDQGLAGEIDIAGWLPQDEIRRLYSRAGIFVLPCIVADDGDMDGIPNAMIEAMAFELPVVSTGISAIPELVEHGAEGLLVPAGDSASLAEAIARLLDDGELRRSLGKRGRLKIQEEFDPVESATAIAALFGERCSTRRMDRSIGRGSSRPLSS